MTKDEKAAVWLPYNLDDELVERIWRAANGFGTHRQIAESIAGEIRARLTGPKTKEVWVVTADWLCNSFDRWPDAVEEIARRGNAGCRVSVERKEVPL